MSRKKREGGIPHFPFDWGASTLYIPPTMLFTSIPFVLFFLAVIGLYYALPHRYRWMLLLASSYYFYGVWKPEYVFLLAGSTLVNYGLGRGLAVLSGERGRKRCLWAGIVFNIGMLFAFKYFNFFSRSVSEVLKGFNIFYDLPLMHILLPVGISFYAFQSLGYLVDVYKGKIEAERHVGFFALFVAFWPQLLSGPINRAPLLLPQLKTEHPFDYQSATEGVRLMLWGMVKKIVIADHLGIYVNRVFNHVDDFQGIPLILAAIFYTVQIYCDFSGYTDMARGAARVMGFDLAENFRHPYFARSLREFWQRWHMSLSTWFRDYLYIPLGGNRVATWRWHYNLFITFLLSGLWHGAAWTYVVWGALHGGVLVLENATGGFQKRFADRLFSDRFPRLNQGMQVGITMGIVSLAWLFFRASSIETAVTMIRKMGNISAGGTGISVVGLPTFLFLAAGIFFFFWVEILEKKEWIHEQVGRLPAIARWGIYFLAAWAIFLSMVFGTKQEFIYFQF